MTAYLLTYQKTADAPFKYVYIIASTPKQARWLVYNKYTHFLKYYRLGFCPTLNDVEEKWWKHSHKIGELVPHDDFFAL